MGWLVDACPDLTRPRPLWGTSLHCPCSSAQSVKEEEHGQWLWVAATRKAQKSSLRPNCMLRGGPVDPIVPKPKLEGFRVTLPSGFVVKTKAPKARSGALKFARLKALNMSAWKRSLN